MMSVPVLLPDSSRALSIDAANEDMRALMTAACDAARRKPGLSVSCISKSKYIEQHTCLQKYLCIYIWRERVSPGG